MECFYGRPLHPGKWFRLGRQGGIWEELWVLRKTLQTWRELLAGDLVVARMNNSTAIAYADYGAGRVPRLTMLGREVEEREVAIGCAVAALHISVGGSMVADTPSRFSVQVRGLGPYPERELRKKFRSEAQCRCGTVVFDMIARNDGLNARGPSFRPPPSSAFEGPLLPGRLWRFPSFELVGRALPRIVSPMKENWFGAHLRLSPLLPWKNWGGK